MQIGRLCRPPLDLHFDTPSSTYIGNDCVLVGVQLLPFFCFLLGL